MTARLSIFHKGLILILSPILLETAIVFSLSSVIAKIDRQQILEANYRESASSVIRMSSLSFDVCMILFAMGMPGSQVSPYYFDSKIAEVRQQTKRVESLMSNDEVFKPIFADVVKVEYTTIDLFEKLGKAIYSVDFTESDVMSQVQGTIDEVVTMLSDTAGRIDEFVGKNDQRIENSSNIVSKLRKDHSYILLLAFILNIVLSIILIVYYRRSIIQRLARIQRNTQILKEGKDLPPALEGKDEIALLDQSFHAMQADLKNTRRKEEMFFENASDVICVIDKNNQFKKVNAAAEKSWGQAADKLRGEKIDSILSTDDRERALASFDACRNTGVATFFECKVMRNRNEAVEFTWSAYYEPVEEQLYCVAHDISIRKQVERARERYISIVSHDLKKPITSIAESYSAVSEIEELPQKAGSKIATVGSNLSRLLSLVNELSHPKALGDEDDVLKISKLNLATLLEKAASDIEGFARSKKVRVACHPLSAEIEADEGRMMQVLVNLLSNAVKFSNEDGLVTLQAKDHGDEIEIEIVDTGRGIPEGKTEAIFEKYKQVDEADGKRSAGTGLGLPICKQIVEQHNGRIGVRSIVDQGSTFWLRIPKAHIEKPAPETPAQQSEFAPESEESQSIPDSTKDASNPEAAKTKSGFGLANLGLMQKGLVLVGIPLVFEIALAGMLTNFFLQSESLARTEIIERKIVNISNQLTFCYREMGIAVLGPSAESVVYKSFDKNLRKTVTLAKQLRALLKNDKQRSARVLFIFNKIKECNSSLKSCFRTRQNTQGSTPNPYISMQIVFKMLKPLGLLTRELQELLFDASKRQARTPAQQKHLRDAQDVLLYGGLITNIAIGLFMARLFSNDIRKRLEQVAQNTRLLAEEKPLNPPVGGRDEIAILDRAFHDAAAELSEARKRERTLFDNSNQVICAVGASGSMTGVNPAASRLWGYSREELLKFPVVDIVIEEDRELTRKKFFGNNTDSGTSTFENRIVAKDGKICDMLWSVTHVRAEQDPARQEGLPLENEVFCMAHDITKQKEADRMRNEFLSIISHDLRTPLAGILVTTAMLQEGGYGALPRAAGERLSSVSVDVNRLLELINDLLDIEKLEAGMMALAYESVKLSDLSEKLAEKCKNMLQEKQISLSVEMDDSAVLVDKDRFTQAMANLLNNAIERSKTGSSINLLADKKSDSFSLIIRDQAPVLDIQARENIFNRFAISDAGTEAATSQMSSLAIPLSKSIISVHGGTVELLTPATSGNEFVIQLPTARLV